MFMGEPSVHQEYKECKSDMGSMIWWGGSEAWSRQGFTRGKERAGCVPGTRRNCEHRWGKLVRREDK